MNKTEYKEYKERAEEEKAKDGYNASQILKICETEIQADIAYQLTKLVTQAKRVAKAQETIANPLLQVDKDGMVHTITPACCDGLKKAVIRAIRIDGLRVPLYVDKALSAHTYKPRDESALEILMPKVQAFLERLVKAGVIWSVDAKGLLKEIKGG